MKSPIAEHKEADVIETREFLLRVIRDPDTPRKEATEASKLLLRAHHALQVDRTTVRATATANPKQSLDRTLTKKERDEIDNLIKPIEPQP